MELLKKTGQVDVYGYAKILANARQHLVESVEQYHFIYDTMYEAVLCNVEPIAMYQLKDRSSMYKSKKDRELMEAQDSHENKVRTSLPLSNVLNLVADSADPVTENRRLRRWASFGEPRQEPGRDGRPPYAFPLIRIPKFSRPRAPLSADAPRREQRLHLYQCGRGRRFHTKGGVHRHGMAKAPDHRQLLDADLRPQLPHGSQPDQPAELKGTPVCVRLASNA